MSKDWIELIFYMAVIGAAKFIVGVDTVIMMCVALIYWEQMRKNHKEK